MRRKLTVKNPGLKKKQHCDLPTRFELDRNSDMALPFFSSGTKKRDQIVAIDLGGRTTKAVHLQRDGDSGGGGGVVEFGTG